MDLKLKELFFLSTLETGRIKEHAPDPMDLGAFNDLTSTIAHSLKAPNLIRTQTPAGTLLKTPVAVSRPFEDENLLKKLLQHRNQIPVSSRIIRAQQS